MKKKKNWRLILLGLFLILAGIIGLFVRTYQSYSVGGSTVQEVTVPEDGERYYMYEAGPQSEFADRATQQLQAEDITVPLILQTDERWAEETLTSQYGTTIAEAGSGITALAMLLSYFEGHPYELGDFDYWMYEDYFRSDQQLSWRFFTEVGEEFGYPLNNLGADFSAVEDKLLNGQPVIVSTKPNTFYPEEHFMILLQKNDQLRILDPLDTPEKEHYKQSYDAAELTDQIQNYWAAY